MSQEHDNEAATMAEEEEEYNVELDEMGHLLLSALEKQRNSELPTFCDNIASSQSSISLSTKKELNS